jgi:dimethylglycine dehydrogenase
VRECFIGFSAATVMSVSFSGELAYEVHVSNSSLYAAYLSLSEAGKKYRMKLFGSRAVESMRMEKGFLAWKSDLLTEFDPFETGLDRFVNLNKDNFIGKADLEKRFKHGPNQKLVCLSIDCNHAPAHAGASLMEDGKVIGTITSGEWGHRVNVNLAYAFVNPDKSEIGNKMMLDLLGEMIPSEVIPLGPYDNSYSRILA